MNVKAHFSLRKVIFVIVVGILLVLGNIFVAFQTVKYLGGENEYQHALKITNDKISDLAKQIEHFSQFDYFKVNPEGTKADADIDLAANQTEEKTSTNNPKKTTFIPKPPPRVDADVSIQYLSELVINPYNDSFSGLTLANLHNDAQASQSSQKVLTVNDTGVVQLVDNSSSTLFPPADGGNPLYFDSQLWKAADKLYFNTGEIGIGKSPGVPLDVNGKAAIEGKLTIHSDWEDNLIELFPNGDSGYLSSSGGALYINNSNNPGSAIGIYSDEGADALGNMINVKVDNPDFAQAAFYMNYDGTSNAVEVVANTNDSSSNALSITNNNQLDSGLGVIGYELAKGTVKISHRKSGDDQNASGLSIDLQGEGTAAQGVYVDSTATGGTTGKLLRLRNQTVDRFVVDYMGSLTICQNGTNTSITKRGNTSGDEFFVGTNGAFRIQRSVTDSEAFRTQVLGDTQGRWLGTADGKLKWGNGSSAQDVVLERSGTSKLLLNGANFDIKSPQTNNDVLTITASDNSRLGRFVETSGGHGWFEVDNNTGTAQVLLRADGGDHYFRTGEVGIGTTAPNYQLDILDDAASSYATNIFNDGNDQNRYGLRIQAGADDGSGTTYYLDAYDGNGDQVGYLANSAGTFAVTDISDRRTKTNIKNTELDGTDIINALRVVDFNRISHPDDPVIRGFIAQEVNQVYPEMVTVAPDGLLGIQKSTLIPVLTKAIQEQQDEINQNTAFNQLLTQAIELKKSLQNTIEALRIKVHTIFENTVQFRSKAIFDESIVTGENISGLVTIPSKATTYTVYFSTTQEKIPQIHLTAQSKITTTMYVDAITKNSFQIHLNEPQDQPVDITWLSIITK
jgi:hypothetical protein